ncbi:MAG: glutamate synthase large subunit [Actinomycetota bacterium]|nr:glutamate synthase large subunit [Actinomycetota bacterium]
MTHNMTSEGADTGLYRSGFEHDACGIGALAHLKGKQSHQMIDDALSMLVNLEHRGGVGLERNTGDGAGILLQIPHRFFRKETQKCGHLLPSERDYGVAMLFLPKDDEGITRGIHVFEEGCARCGVQLLFWRDVPVDPHDLGETARSCMPTIKQAFLARPHDIPAGEAFERRLYVCRRTIEKSAAADPGLAGRIFYICSMSARTIVYKGMLVSTQLRRFFRDLDDASTETAIALVHSRYSTNTTPSWERAHPNRYIVHNGEINTLCCNVNWTRARESNLYSPIMNEDLTSVLPILNGEGSDSAMLDNVLEFVKMNGRKLARAVSMVLPEPWDNNSNLSDKRRAWGAYQSMLTEAWDGPAAIAFSDGHVTGATIDRNGLRPARYCITSDDRLILSSEVGVLDVDPSSVLIAGSLGPGQMMLVDPDQGRVLFDDEIKDGFANEKPYRSWIDAEMLTLDELVDGSGAHAATYPDADIPLHERQAQHGYFFDDIEEAIIPMAENGAAPLASMGVDVPLACLSEKPRSFFDYFNQLFAQVTNPPIDALRESFITSTLLYVGSHGNLLEDARSNCRLVRLDTPLLEQAQFDALAHIERHGFESVTLHAVYDVDGGPHALDDALRNLRREAETAVRSGANLVLISDRADTDHVPIPSLLAVSSVHNHLLGKGLRTHADIIVESGDAITPHDFAVLVGYSASGIFPYLAHDTIRKLCDRGVIGLDADEAIGNYDRAIVAGIVSIMSKMGISTMQGYHAAQVFEAVGLSDKLVEEHFTGTVSRIGGLGIDDVQRECDERQALVHLQRRSPSPDQLPSSGMTSWRPLGGEEHLLNPMTINLLQRAVRENDLTLFDEYSDSIHATGRAIMLRDLLEFAPTGNPIPLDDVEPASEIVKRFNTGAMSYGSISQEAHECLAIAMNRIHGRSNSGEGGEDPARETTLPNGDSMRSAIKQIASGRFGVTSRYLMSADEIQIKMAQGAKPGEGGHLPSGKVWPWIAHARRCTPGVGLISPPPHHDIYSIEDLAEVIFDMKNANPRARISVKLVAEAGVGTIATGVAKGGAHKILISGSNGGTGAAPRDSIYHAGLPLELGLAETQQTLLRNGLRSRVVLEADGKLMDGRDVAIACLLGAEEFGFATMPLIAMGCLMQRDCQQDTCPVGIATQNCRLRRRFGGKPEHVVNFMMMVAEQLRCIMADLGFAKVEDMVGHSECLRQHTHAHSWKAGLLDLSPLLVRTRAEFGQSLPGTDCPHSLASCAPEDTLPQTLDGTLLIPYTNDARNALASQRFHVDIANVNRCVGTMLGSEVTRRHAEGLPDETLTIDCTGSGGVSFGAFLPAGITLNIEGEANDFLGKGLSGGIVTVKPPRAATYRPEENIIAGNVAFYGATSGRGFVNGLAGQRFAVRNSGATLVVEGVGNNGCEYMTGGTVLILGEVGLNFAAGMSGGVAYVYDAEHTLSQRCNQEMVDLKTPDRNELDIIRKLIDEHARRTGSPLGVKFLYRFNDMTDDFVKVIPREYEHMVGLTAELEASGLAHDEAVAQAFELRGARS